MDQLVLKSINELLDENFFIPHYQRGYRWATSQVNDLLDDIWAFANLPKGKEAEFYCLQPIVVKSKTWMRENVKINGWEVVDGQQRLTTIYIILYYLTKEFLKVESLRESYGKEIYSLQYETRPGSESFLKKIEMNTSNIDFYYISQALETVKNWFVSGVTPKDLTDKFKFLSTILGKCGDERSVQIIWYHVDTTVESVELFTRLNMGKIPLTNAELIKALFLSSAAFAHEHRDDANRKKIEISQQWDQMEQKLAEPSFWSFITNEKEINYSTRIELLFNAISEKEIEEIDPMHTFLYFLRESKNDQKELWNLWLKIEQYYLTISEWYVNKDLYHKIGYLISVDHQIHDLIKHSMKSYKSQFEKDLNQLISESLNFDLETLSYDNPNHYDHIERVLLLFNVESIRQKKRITEFYPFKFHKETLWSLEHIHAQNSEGLDRSKKDSWYNWLDYHFKMIEEILAEDIITKESEPLKNLLNEIESLNKEKLTWDQFSVLSAKIINQFTDQKLDSNAHNLHSISNMALLSQPDNSALNNSVFEVKRRALIKLDKEGSYIPLCTRRVFLKYYSEINSSQQIYFWSQEDRTNYIKEIKHILSDYLTIENQLS